MTEHDPTGPASHHEPKGEPFSPEESDLTGEGKDLFPKPPVPPKGELIKSPPAADAPGITGSSSAGSALDFLHRRLGDMERDLFLERERTRQAEDRLRQQDQLRGEADKQLKEILERLREEKEERERNEEKSHARGRIDALEQRLDEMHRTWADLLREALAKKSQDESSASMAASASGIPQPPPERLVEELRDVVTRFTSGLEDRLGALMRERAALGQAVEDSRHQIRAEFAKEQAALQSQFNDKLEDVKKSINLLQSTYLNSFQEALPLKEQMEKLHQNLAEPRSATDAVIADLEQQKRDLMKALKDRTDQLRSYTLERREVERSMGEAMMDLNRNLETQRARYQQLESSVADLRLQISSLSGQLDLAQKTIEEKDKRFATLASERDEIAKALLNEAQKVQQQIAERTQSDKGWDERLARFNAMLAEEKDKRLAAEGQVSDLRAKMQTLTEHMTRTLQEREKTESQTASWKQDREELLATLQKKEEMISMLSATFQNMLRK